MGPLVIVIGAGASNEFGLPVGNELTTEVANALDVYISNASGVLPGALVHAWSQWFGRGNDVNSLFDVCRCIRVAMPLASSIDAYIDSHSGDKHVEFCGKLAITLCILRAEQRSPLQPTKDGKLYFGGPIDFALVKTRHANWLGGFFRLFEGCHGIEEIRARLRRVTIICFNYDRCIQHYLYWAFQLYYRISAETSASLLGDLKIFHPYGSVGSLPWESSGGPAEFGAELNSEQLIAQSDGIRTFTEGTDEVRSKIKDIRGSLRAADRILFLGFAFHEVNLSLLFSDKLLGRVPIVQRTAKIYSTARGIPQGEAALIKTYIESRTLIPVKNMTFRGDLEAWHMFEEYPHALSLLE